MVASETRNKPGKPVFVLSLSGLISLYSHNHTLFRPETGSPASVAPKGNQLITLKTTPHARQHKCFEFYRAPKYSLVITHLHA